MQRPCCGKGKNGVLVRSSPLHRVLYLRVGLFVYITWGSCSYKNGMSGLGPASQWSAESDFVGESQASFIENGGYGKRSNGIRCIHSSLY